MEEKEGEEEKWKGRGGGGPKKKRRWREREEGGRGGRRGGRRGRGDMKVRRLGLQGSARDARVERIGFVGWLIGCLTSRKNAGVSGTDLLRRVYVLPY